jgi:hypothetical protein
MNDRDATPEELAELEERVMERAKQIVKQAGFVWDAVGQLPDEFWTLAGEECLKPEDEGVQIWCGRRVLRAIRESAIRHARKELGA